MDILLPKQVKTIIGKLEKSGFEAYAVGGCVRDSLLGRTPSDWDITTDAKPEQVKALFRRTVDTGIQHGTVTVLLDGEGYEVTTYRIDGKYADGRHPEQVTFTPHLEEDLLRRDFTINAMAYSERHGLVDLYGGRKDLEDGVIRCVGNARHRFTEDALRILRAVRFGAQLGFVIEEETAQAAEALAENLRLISAERIQTEMVKLLVSDHPDHVGIAYELGMMKYFMPEVTVTEMTKRRLLAVEPDRHLREAMLLCNLEPDMATTVLRRLKLDNDTVRTVAKLVAHSRDQVEPSGRSVRHSIYQVGTALYPMELKLWKGLARAGEQALDVSAGESAPVNRQAAVMPAAQVEKIEEIYLQTIENGCCLSLKELAVKGQDLLDLGIRGKQVGDLLETMLLHVLDCPEDNVREKLLEGIPASLSQKSHVSDQS